ncbi:MAG: YceI family protein [Acidobacteriota bacterium]
MLKQRKGPTSMIRKLPSALILVALFSVSVSAQTYTVDKAHSSAGFEIRHLLSKVHGRFSDFAGTINADFANPQKSTVEFTINVKSINTDNDQRDNHLRSSDFFDVDKFPQITFKSTSVKAAGKNKYDVTGDFTMRGVTKVITLPVTYLGSMKDQGGKVRAGFETAIELKRSDYGIVWNRALEGGGYLLDDEVDIQISIEAQQAAATAK